MRGAVSPEGADRQEEMLANRVAKSFRRWHRAFEKQGIGAFRLYDRDIPEVRVVVDWYEGHVVVAEYEREQTRFVADWLDRMGAAVAHGLALPPGRVHLKRRRTRPGDGERYGRFGRQGTVLDVREGDLRFRVNLDDFIDVGLFADHRDTRQLVRREAAGRRFLNLHAYTGTFTCQAVRGGAASTTSVDLSKSYLAWARENLELNGLAGDHELVVSDVVAFLDEAKRAERCWDLVVCDPPSFSTVGGPRGRFDVLRDHPWLLERVLGVMADGGRLFFSTNHQRFVPRLESLAASAVEEITRQTVPADYRNRTAHRCWLLTR